MRPIIIYRYPAPQGLAQRILQAIVQEKRTQIVRRLLLFSLSSVAFIGIAVSLLARTIAALAQSGTWAYLQLLFSDFQAMLGNWQEFSLSLLASLPISEIISASVSLVGLAVLLFFVLTNLVRLNSLPRTYGY